MPGWVDEAVRFVADVSAKTLRSLRLLAAGA